jgi:hypothetical protein
MSLTRTPSAASVIDVLDHVLDKGIVIDAWMRVSLAGIDLITLEARVVVASIGTYVTHAQTVTRRGLSAPARAPDGGQRDTIEDQLQRVRRLLDAGSVLQGREQQRAEDRVLEELRDARARIAGARHPDRNRRSPIR